MTLTDRPLSNSQAKLEPAAAMMHLSRYMQVERRRALDAEELAAYLEADGFSDETLQEHYSLPDLFTAAEALYAQPDTATALETAVKIPQPVFPYHTLLRGLLYMLPGVTGALLGHYLGAETTPAFIFASAFGWGWSMFTAALRYAEPLAIPGRALRLALMTGGVLGTIGSYFATVYVAGWHTALSGTLLGAVVVTSLGSAGILLSLSKVSAYIKAFALPLSLALVASLLGEGKIQDILMGLSLLSLSVAPTLSALHATRRPGQLAASWATLWPYFPSALYGWMMAAAFVALTQRIGTWNLLPILLGSGLLEAAVWHAQAMLQYFAATSMRREEIQRRGIPTVLLAAAGYALSVAALLGLEAFWVPPGMTAQAIFSSTCFGASLVLSAWLYNQRLTVWLAAVWGITAGLLYWTAVTPLPVLSITLLVLLFSTIQRLSDPRSYR